MLCQHNICSCWPRWRRPPILPTLPAAALSWPPDHLPQPPPTPPRPAGPPGRVRRYCRHRDTLLWLLRLYTLCYMHIRMAQCWGTAGALSAGALPKLAYVYAWLALSSMTWQLRFSHHLPVTVLAHAVNIALLWQSSCPTTAAAAAAVGLRPQSTLECGMLGVLMGTLYVMPALLVVYYVERRARNLFAAFLPFWEAS
jgi:hypothetical protein